MGVPLLEGDDLYEAFSDQARTKNLCDGIFLFTIHSIKGLEFDHVFLLGDGWRKKQGLEMEERRLYYVGMSRARETLHLGNLVDLPNPHATSIAGDFLSARVVSSEKRKLPVNRQYVLLGMGDLFIDFAGIQTVNHPLRFALQKLQAGDRLQLKVRNDHIEPVDNAGVSVARLAKSAQEQWQGKIDLIRESRVGAMVRVGRCRLSRFR